MWIRTYGLPALRTLQIIPAFEHSLSDLMLYAARGLGFLAKGKLKTEIPVYVK